MASWSINGLAVSDALGLHLLRETTWALNVTVRQSPIEIPGEHGSIQVGLPTYESGTVTMSALAVASSEAAVESAIAQFKALCGSPSLVLTRTSGDVVSTAAARLVSVTPADWAPGAWSVRIVAIFAIPGVFLRGPVWTSSDIAAMGDLSAAELTGLSTSTAPIGDVTMRITGPCANPYVSDPSTGTGLSYIDTVGAGRYLFMSARPLSARLSSSSADWLSGGTDVSAALTYPGAGRLQLWPVVQTATTRKVQVSMTGSGRTSATKLAVRGQAAYL
jgi:hypothetical protein